MKRLLLLLPILLFLMACGPSVEIDGEKVKYEDLQEKIKVKKDELKNLESDTSAQQSALSDVVREVTSNEEKLEEIADFTEREDSAKKKLKENNSKLKDLEKSIAKKEEEIETLDGEILKYKDEPIKINPGFYYFGEDGIAPGRYKIMAQDGAYGNVFIRSDGRSYVSNTFGDGVRGSSIKEFTFKSSEGDEIEATIPILLYQVE